MFFRNKYTKNCTQWDKQLNSSNRVWCHKSYRHVTSSWTQLMIGSVVFSVSSRSMFLFLPVCEHWTDQLRNWNYSLMHCAIHLLWSVYGADVGLWMFWAGSNLCYLLGKLLCWAPVFIIIIFCYLLKPSKYIVLHTFELLGLIIPFLIQECCICLCPYEDGVELRELPCNHHFHCSCIDKWLHINATCPLCKFNIVKSNLHREEV